MPEMRGEGGGRMTGIELLRKYAETRSLTLLTCRQTPEALGKECDDFRSCNDCHMFVCNAIADQIERETLPRPRFEDGEPVQFGDKYEAYGHVRMVERITFFKDRWIVSERFDNSNVSDGPLKRPEPPDSWEQVEIDVNRGSGFEHMDKSEAAAEVLRRCKALAGVD